MLPHLTISPHTPKLGTDTVTLRRMKSRRLVFAVLNYAVHASMTGAALSLCDYTPSDFYIVNTTATSTVFPNGYLSCSEVTGNDAELCDTCLCREKKVTSVAEVSVTRIVCVRSKHITSSTCAGRDQECCGCNDGGMLDDSTFNDDVNVVDVVDLTGGRNISSGSTSSPSNLTSELAIDHPSKGDSSATMDTSPNTSNNLNTDESVQATPTITPEPVVHELDRQGGSHFIDKSNSVPAPGVAGSHIDLENGITSIASIAADSASESANVESSAGTNRTNISLKPAVTSTDLDSKMAGSVEDNYNMIDGIVESTQTNEASSTGRNVTHPQDNGSTLGTNNGSSSHSAWSGRRLTTGLSAICIAGVVAAIVILIVMRRDQLKKNVEPGTPTDDLNHNNSSMVTPRTYGKRASRYSRATKCMVSSFENDSLASIVVLGPGDDFLAPPISASEHQYRMYPGEGEKELNTSYEFKSARSCNDMLMRQSRSSFSDMATQHQFYESHGPSIRDLPSPSLNPIFDTSNTHESFSSDMNSQFNTPPGDEISELEDGNRMLSEISRGSDSNSSASTNSCERFTSSEPESEENTAVPIFSSVEYNICDAESNEHTHEPEMNTNSSFLAISFDLNSI